jgi:glycosyltransferase involved in cell wall biosynthesis
VKIGYLVSQYPAPSHTFIRREVASLRRRGLDVSTFSIRPGEPLSAEDREEASLTVNILPASVLAVAGSVLSTLARRPGRWAGALRTTLGLRLPGARNLARSLAYFAEAMRLAENLERRGVGHLHNHFANASSHVGLAAASYLGIGWSLTLHGFADFESAFTPRLGAKIEAARFVATATRFGRERAAAAAPAHAAKLHVVRCGIEVDRLPPPGRRYPGPGEPLQILSVGRLSPEKGQVGLVEAFASAVRAGLDARLVLVGGGPEEARVREAAERSGVADRIELRGRLPEAAVLEAMAAAHVFVLSSLSEGLPVVLMEALAMGLPVVAPAISGIPELVVHGETGLLFEAGRWDQLGERIAEMGGSVAERARLAAAGRERVLAEYDIDRATAPLVALFEGAIP